MFTFIPDTSNSLVSDNPASFFLAAARSFVTVIREEYLSISLPITFSWPIIILRAVLSAKKPLFLSGMIPTNSMNFLLSGKKLIS